MKKRKLNAPKTFLDWFLVLAVLYGFIGSGIAMTAMVLHLLYRIIFGG